MPFPFSFRFSVPGIVNPFHSTCESDSASVVSRFTQDIDKMGSSSSQTEPQRPVLHRHPSPSLIPPKPLVRKRGWAPSESEPSHAAAKAVSTSGYLDTPAKYREMALYSETDEMDEMIADLPAPKRRKTLAGSIVSTALSAALIGTAVGFTVYRLWRDRGRHPELPPPPYEQGEWDPSGEQSSPVPSTHVTPPTPRFKKQRHVAGRRTAPRHRKIPSRTSVITPPASSPPPTSSAFGFSAVEDEEEPDDQMDWMGDRLQHLIEEGKRALGTEIVVMSEAKEDEVDDGSGAWEEEEPILPPSRSSSIRRGRRPRNIALPDYNPPTYSTPQVSPRKPQFDLNSSRSYGFASTLNTPESPKRTPRGASAESLFSNHREPENAWGTPEMRESMARAREAYRKRLGQ
ncbi:hypothetical protein EUX98_g4683 [Antrodiella citrinella]|uniref:Uncharacterized protein n=1 Tax=Antrodiella citrinella TaxID=2447956 RepID=A0A4S4MVV1_9APHY|nr:hypothetical protein EUX98_g4683 [Antrodiella citrinella]